MNTSFETKEFACKRVLVTGGTKGAGKAIAERFQRGGAMVIVTARSALELPIQETARRRKQTLMRSRRSWKQVSCLCIKLCIKRGESLVTT
jgi:NAD(P)-dependent dehydrogenase (short-subunit alcohol dehydrogenase family)